MRVNSIKLKDYRNYNDLELSFDSSRNILIGENAQGKTNLIEAIYMSAFAKSFRTNNTAELVMIDRDIARIEIDAENILGKNNISIAIDKSGKKMIKKDGKLIRRTTELLNNIVVVIFSPEDLRIIKDNPEKRRNFINKEISQLRPKYYECLKNYNDVLKQRNMVLKERVEYDEEMMDIYDMQLSKYGSEIIKYRKNFINDISNKANIIQKNITGGKESIEIRYRNSISENNYYEKMKNLREGDIEKGYTSYGPHRDDIEFYINGKDVRKFGSQGQQRTISLSLKLAEINIAKEYLGENPILLLDDVLSELDKERQKFLFNEIEDVQLFITTTDINENLIEKIENSKIYAVSGGKIEEYH